MPSPSGRNWWRRYYGMTKKYRKSWRQTRDFDATQAAENDADLKRFATYLARIDGCSSEYRWDDFDELWADYMMFCGETNSQALSARRLQQAWSLIGGDRDRPNSGSSRKTVYRLHLPNAEVLPINRRSA